MNDEQAKNQLAELLDHYTAGSVLHLVAELYQQAAEEAQQAGDAVASERFKNIEHALFVVGLGVDAANPA